jgi:L-rhamnose mutarotase
LKYFGFTINVKDDPQAIEQYKAYHRAVWPEVLEHARNAGILKTRIFLLGRSLFLYIETTDEFDLSNTLVPQTEDHPRRQEWDALMRGLMEKVPEAQAEEWWAQMELVHES